MALPERSSAILSLFLAFALCLGWISDSRATLYVYRLGGADLPAPTFPAEWDAEFVSLPWTPIDEDGFGTVRLIDTADGSIGPERMDPEVNLTPELRGRPGGWIKSSDGYGFQDEPQLDFLFDGDPTTAYDGGGGHFKGGSGCSSKLLKEQCNGANRYLSGTNSKAVWFDLGGAFPIRLIRMYPTTKHFDERVLKVFLIGTSDGDPLKEGTRDSNFYWRSGPFNFNLRHLMEENTVPLLELDMGGMPARHIFLETIVGRWEIAEVEIYGGGFAPSATYTSNLIPLGEPGSLGSLTWSGSRDEGAEVELTMRSGSDDDPNIYWRHTFRGSERSQFDASGKPLTRAAYLKLEGGEQAGIAPDTRNWEFWTPPLDFDEQKIRLVAERPRQFVQFNADFLSERPADAGSRLDFLEFTLSKPPIVSQVVAEIFPVAVPPREVTRFTYTLLPEFARDDLGFDSIEIETPVQAASVDTIILSSPTDPLAIDTLDVTNMALLGPSGFLITLPEEYRRDAQSSLIPIQVIFRAQVFQYGTVFEGRVFDSTREWEVHQRLAGGDADPLVDGNTLSVALTEVETGAVLRLSSPALTPNGDGINDELTIAYELVNMVGSVPVTVGFFDLSGRKVAEVVSQRASGQFTETWDGTDGSGNLMPPGMYILRMEVETDERTDTVTEAVALVY
jgi:hypothetical protein